MTIAAWNDLPNDMKAEIVSNIFVATDDYIFQIESTKASEYNFAGIVYDKTMDTIKYNVCRDLTDTILKCNGNGIDITHVKLTPNSHILGGIEFDIDVDTNDVYYENKNSGNNGTVRLDAHVSIGGNISGFNLGSGAVWVYATDKKEVSTYNIRVDELESLDALEQAIDAVVKSTGARKVESLNFDDSEVDEFLTVLYRELMYSIGDEIRETFPANGDYIFEYALDAINSINPQVEIDEFGEFVEFI